MTTLGTVRPDSYIMREMKKDSVRELYRRLRDLDPEPTTELDYQSPFELLVAVLLSAQATDKSVNLATKGLFAAARSPAGRHGPRATCRPGADQPPRRPDRIREPARAHRVLRAHSARPEGAGGMTSERLKVWVVDDDRSIRWVLERAMS